MRKIKKICFVLICFVLLWNTGDLVQASDTVNCRTVRVGFFSADGYHVVDEDGTMRGYGYDFLQMMLRYNDWKYEYVGYDKNWGDMLDMLENGEIDLVTLANKTPEREEKFDYSEKSIGTSSVIMTISGKNTQIIAGDYETYNEAVVGLVEGSSHNEKFEEYAKEKGFTYTTKYYEDIADLLSDLHARKGVDIAVTSNMRQVENEIILDEFNATEYYAIVKKGNETLLNQLNKAIAQLNVYSPDWRTSLFQKYYADINSNVISFSVEERDYLNKLEEDGTVVKAAMNPELKPYSYFEDGEAKGIAPALFKEIAKRVGISYEIIPSKDRWEYKEQLDSGEADIDLTAYLDYSLAQKYNLKETDAYINSTLAMLTTRDSNTEEDSMVVAVVRDPTEYIGYNKDLIYRYQTKEYESIQECIDAVKNGEADATFRYVYIAEQAVAADYTNQLQYSIMQDYNFSLAIGVNNEKDHRLLSILNKGVNSIDSAFSQSVMLQESTNIQQDSSVLTIAYDHPWMVLFAVVFVLVVCLAIAFLLILNRVQNNKKQVLRDALKSARSASMAKGQFLSRMSHEIRTPLNAVIGYMEIAMDSKDNPTKMLHCVQNSDMAARHLLNIINDVLDMSSIESGKMKIANEEFDLKQQLTSISTIFYHQAKEKQVSFHVILENVTQEWIVGDTLRLNQILMNLLSNAVKFTPKDGDVTLSVTQLNSDAQKVYLRFAVTDTGIGMSEEYQKKLFEPFEQESAKTAQKYGGSGLGLSITYNLIHMMGGSIDVNSTQGEGSTFSVSLGFLRGESQASGSQSVADYSKMRVLFLEDQPQVGDYMKNLLKKFQIKCDVVQAQEGAIKKIRGRVGTDYPYDLCLMDWNRTKLDGAGTAAEIKKQCGEEAPLLVALAYDVTEYEDQAAKIGVHMLQKPIFQSTILELLHSIYGKQETQGKAKEQTLSIEGLKILLAEDNEMNLEIAMEILKKAGLKVEAAMDGKQALEHFTETEPGTYDAILMDVQMPVMDGYQATKEIRNSTHPEAKTIPIIAMTANAFAEDVTTALAYGMNGHIAKPVAYDKLFRVLNKYCGKEPKGSEETSDEK